MGTRARGARSVVVGTARRARVRAGCTRPRPHPRARWVWWVRPPPRASRLRDVRGATSPSPLAAPAFAALAQKTLVDMRVSIHHEIDAMSSASSSACQLRATAPLPPWVTHGQCPSSYRKGEPSSKSMHAREACLVPEIISSTVELHIVMHKTNAYSIPSHVKEHLAGLFMSGSNTNTWYIYSEAGTLYITYDHCGWTTRSRSDVHGQWRVLDVAGHATTTDRFTQ
jgi:hypothetical protein